ncbi:MAG: M56 family metallopeptidase, partial [Verrucomicrobiota bacterium]
MSELIRVFLTELLVASRDAALLALLIGIVILLFGRSIPPTWRHVLWLLVALRLCLPALPSSPVSWQRLLPEKADPVAAKSFDEQPAPASPLPSKTIAVPIPAEPERFRVPVTEPEDSPVIAKQDLRINGWILGGALWLSGCLICLFVGLYSLFRFRKRLRRLAVTDEPMIAEVKRVVREISPSRPYRINLTEAVHVPAVHGLFRPEILLPPSSIETLDEEALRLILWHEIAHLRRGDLWVNWLLFYLQAIHWFNPAMWWAFRKIRIAAESAADAWVLRQSRCEAKPVDYGEALLGFLERENSATARHFLPGLVRVVERPQDLKARIKAIARFSRKRSRWATAATCALLLGLSAVGLTQAPEEKKSEEATQANLEIRATVRDENGDPVQDATVTLVAYTPFSKRTLEAVSDRDGEAIFDPAELDELPGRMNGEFYAKKETIGLSVRGYTFSWGEGKRKSVAVELVLSEGLPLRLRVVDLEGFPVEGLEVFASRFSEKDRESGFLSANPSKLESNPWSATTNSNGEATLRRIPRNAKVYVDHRDNRYGQVEGAHHTQFRFDPEAEEENRIDLEPASTISGRVVLPGDLPVAGAEVRALEHYGYVRGGSHGNAVTSANGTFTLPRMLASVYSIKVTLPDDLAKDWVVPILRSVEVEIGEDILLDDLVGESGGLIEGRVTLPDSGDGVPYAQVGITVPEKVSPLYQWWGKADESGRYRIRLESGLKKLYLGGLPPEGYR